MIFRPQGLLPVRQKLLAYGRELYVAARRAAQAVTRSWSDDGARPGPPPAPPAPGGPRATRVTGTTTGTGADGTTTGEETR